MTLTMNKMFVGIICQNNEREVDYSTAKKGKSEEQLPQKTVGRLLVNSWPTVYRQSADRLLGELFFTFTPPPKLLFWLLFSGKSIHNILILSVRMT